MKGGLTRASSTRKVGRRLSPTPQQLSQELNLPKMQQFHQRTKELSEQQSEDFPGTLLSAFLFSRFLTGFLLAQLSSFLEAWSISPLHSHFCLDPLSSDSYLHFTESLSQKPPGFPSATSCLFSRRHLLLLHYRMGHVKPLHS